MTTPHPSGQPDEAKSDTRDLYRAAFAAPTEEPRPRPVRSRPAHPARPGYQGAVAASGLLLLVGMWLIVAPFLLDYVEVGGIDGSWNSVVSGAAVAFVALLGLSRVARPPMVAALAGGLGAWLLSAQHVLGYTDEAPRASVNETTCGVLVILLAVTALGFTLAARPEPATGSEPARQPADDRTADGTRAA